MGYEFQQAVRKCQGLTSTAKLVANALDDRMGRKKKCYPSYKTIGEDAGVCRDSVRRGLSRLETCGLLLITRRPYDSSVYRWASAWAEILPRLTINLGRPSVQTRLKFSTDWAEIQPVTTKEPLKNHQLAAKPPDEPSKPSHSKRGTQTQTPGAGSTEAPPRQPLAEHPAFIAWFVERYKAVMKVKYRFAKGKDGELVKQLLKELGLERLKLAADVMFADKWAVSVTPTIGLLSSQLNKWIAGSQGYDANQGGNWDGSKAKRGRLR